ncbi:MAG: ABC transporter permease [Candidatus Dormibacteraeota bacterium]|uniref:ABC transporter permease n=2 Tax=Candidatus Dormiibacter inghamiae TaxID=3127013 RepID=A0A934NHB2_9BACT|nr:ABC transporter permease [Candidatus Dormibacteraeota bacterium]MBJ7606464.1 ABC transporter permease [Candidatus Dormibacteraeota bacterium]
MTLPQSDRADSAAAEQSAVSAPPPIRRRPLRRLLTTSPVLMSAVLLFLVIVFSAIRPDAFPSLANAQNVVMDAAALLVMAVGMTYIMIAAGIDLSVGSVLVFAGVCSAKVMGAIGSDNWGTVLVGLAVALAAGLAWGLFNGLAITKLRVPALITTLGTLGAALGAANLVTHGNDVRTVPLTLIEFGVGGPFGLSWIVWVAIAVAIVGGLVLARTRFGRHTYVIGSNAEAGRRAGINVDNHLLKLYGLSGLLAGLAGWLSLARFATTTIAGHSTDVLAVITGVVLGGTSLFGGFGTVGGTVVGILIPTALSNGFIIVNVEPFWQEVATGFILIAAVYVDQIKRRARDRA